MQYKKNETADEAYARRLALSQPTSQAAPQFQMAAGSVGAGLGAGPSRSETADEAYARRVAMSAGGGGGGGLGSSSGMGYGAGLGAGGPPAFVRPTALTPNFVSSNNNFVPPVFTPPAPSEPSASVPTTQNPAEDRAAQIQQRLAAAKAIAEKIAAIKGPPAEEEVKAVVQEVEQVRDTTGMSGEDVVAMLAKEVEAKTGSTE